MSRDVLIVGAGPAGLAAANEIVGHGGRPLVVERLGQVGGLSRTIVWKGARFDIGPHRFFTKNAEVRQLFEDVVAEDLVRVRRLTRIRYGGHYFNYPLTAVNALKGVGPVRASASAMPLDRR